MQESSRQKYVFWIFGWDNNPRLMSSELFKCEINMERIRIYSEPIFEIPLNSIKECSLVFVGSSYNMRGFVKITSADESIIYLVTANPINPNDAVYSVGGEVHDMITVINSFLKGEVSSLEMNPYLRSFKRKNQNKLANSKAWNQDTSPWEYFPKIRVTIAQFLLSSSAGFIFVIVLLLIILALLGQVHISFQ